MLQRRGIVNAHRAPSRGLPPTRPPTPPPRSSLPNHPDSALERETSCSRERDMGREEESVLTRFSPGDAVEVSSDDEGFRGAWYEAKVLRPLPRASCYAVVYDHLHAGSDENLRPLHETVHASHVRPRPPLHAAPLLVPHRPVDAWYNDGWWVGVLMAAITGGRKGKKTRYTVCFPSFREEMVFEAAHLRPHLEWVNNQWIDPELITSVRDPLLPARAVHVPSIFSSSLSSCAGVSSC